MTAGLLESTGLLSYSVTSPALHPPLASMHVQWVSRA